MAVLITLVLGFGFGTLIRKALNRVRLISYRALISETLWYVCVVVVVVVVVFLFKLHQVLSYSLRSVSGG